jgi:hypothetical protein
MTGVVCTGKAAGMSQDEGSHIRIRISHEDEDPT